MDLILELLDAVLHVDRHLHALVLDYGVWVYGVLFLIVFCETGLVVTPFLPGDSLLFAAGALAGISILNVWVLAVLLIVAAVLGDTVNYWIGRKLRLAVLHHELRFLNRKHLERTHQFYERHGGKTIILARFVPIVRTFAPFVAGVGEMTYPRFFSYNVIGGIIWVLLFVLGGYFFGSMPIVQENFGMVIIAIIFISVVPILFELIRSRLSPAGQAPADGRVVTADEN